MIRINEITDEIEDMLYDGYTADEVIATLNVPAEWVKEVEAFMLREGEYPIDLTVPFMEFSEELSIVEDYRNEEYF